MTKYLHQDLIALGQRIDDIVSIGEPSKSGSATIAPEQQVKAIIAESKALLNRIDREIPLLQLAITASGESLSSSLAPGISPSRLLQASTLLTLGDTQFSTDPSQAVQIGPVFSLSLYMLFLAHTTPAARPSNNWPNDATKGGEELGDVKEPCYGLGEGERRPIWQEVVHKAQLRLHRAPLDLLDDNGD